ncbi:Putative methyltransferase C9orf114 [Cladobotryum mycophilum]|uniref:Methyltransferase C9orf114 n=1 Tax=Cladobotryum mycophilum TaxID=491253 RepID=A0ABR0SHH7_9HYPO
MSYQERDAKKRKTAQHGAGKPASFQQSSQFAGQTGRNWTVSVAFPTSTLTNLSNAEQRIQLPGRIARALAIFSVDEVIIFDDTPVSARPRNTDTTAYTGDTDPTHFLSHILSFLEAPPFMRKSLFGLHPNLRITALLPTLDMPHHPHPKEWLPYREGVTVAGKTSTGKGTLVEIGTEAPAEIDEDIPLKTRVTLKFSETDETERPQCVHPHAPRTEAGYYWGYTVRKSDSLSNVFTESPYDEGYDISIGTSERGTPVKEVGLEFAAMNDEQLGGMGISGGKTRELFDHWVNVLPGQGSRTIRTEEAMFIAMTALSGLWAH